MRHKKFQFLLWLSILFTLLISSVTSAQNSYLDSLDGKFALQFQISNFFKLEEFQGTTLSGKYHLSKREAIRLGVSLNADKWDGKHQEDYTNGNPTLLNEYDGNNIFIDLRLQYINYIKTGSSISFYGGIGPLIGYNKYNRTSTEESDESSEGFKAGLNIIAGVEWLFHEDMSLSAEYGIEFSYITHNSKTYYSAYTISNNSKYFNINAETVNFGISVYF